MESLPADSRIAVAVVRFNSAARLDIPLEDKLSRTDLGDFLAGLSHSGGSTSLAGALDVVIRYAPSRVP